MQVAISIPKHVPLAVIEAALRELGASIVPKRVKLAKPEKVFEPLIYTKTLQDGTTETREMDGVSVDKAIRKLMSGVNARSRFDGRNPAAFPDRYHGANMTTAQYVAAFCSALNHVKAAYTTDAA